MVPATAGSVPFSVAAMDGEPVLRTLPEFTTAPLVVSPSCFCTLFPIPRRSPGSPPSSLLRAYLLRTSYGLKRRTRNEAWSGEVSSSPLQSLFCFLLSSPYFGLKQLPTVSKLCLFCSPYSFLQVTTYGYELKGT